MIPFCKMSIVDEVYQNYEIGDMLSSKKAPKTRAKAAEIHLTFVIGLMKLRQTRGIVND